MRLQWPPSPRAIHPKLPARSTRVSTPQPAIPLLIRALRLAQVRLHALPCWAIPISGMLLRRNTQREEGFNQRSLANPQLLRMRVPIPLPIAQSRRRAKNPSFGPRSGLLNQWPPIWHPTKRGVRRNRRGHRPLRIPVHRPPTQTLCYPRGQGCCRPVQRNKHFPSHLRTLRTRPWVTHPPTLSRHNKVNFPAPPGRIR